MPASFKNVAGYPYEGDKLVPIVYENPPLAEALCDIVFQPSKHWDVTIPGLFYHEIRGDFKIEEFSEQSGANIVGGAATGEEDSLEDAVSVALRFKSEDGNRVVQLFPNHMTVNTLGVAYNGWDEFKQKVLDILEKYIQVAHPTGIKRLSLRYVNKFQIPVNEEHLFNITEFFTIAPLSPKLPGLSNGYLVRIDLVLPEGKMTVQSAMPAGQGPDDENGNAALVFLDLEITHSASKEPMQLGEILPWLENGHLQIEKIFQASITPRCEQLFGGKTERADDEVKIN